MAEHRRASTVCAKALEETPPRTALWDASGLTGSFGTPPACLSAPVATMLVATLMCHRVHVRRATSCKRSTDAARQAGEIAHATTAGGAFLADCALLASLKRAGVIDQVEMEVVAPRD